MNNNTHNQCGGSPCVTLGPERYLMGAGDSYLYKQYPDSRATLDGLTTRALNCKFYGKYGSK